MVTGQNDDVLRTIAANDVEVLRDRIGGAAIPALTMHTLLRR